MENLIPGPRSYFDCINVEGRCHTVNKSGGDWIKIIALKASNALVVYCGDVTGHSVAAAALAGVASGALESYYSPMINTQNVNILQAISESILKLNALVANASGSLGFAMTMSVVALDLKTMTVLYTNCGHRPPFLVTHGVTRPLICPGSLLGLNGYPFFEIRTFELKSESRILLYTDGLVENRNPQGRVMSSRKFQKILLDDQLPLKTYTELVFSRVVSFLEGNLLEDDMTLVCLEYFKTKPRSKC